MRFRIGLFFLCIVLLNGIVFSQTESTVNVQDSSVVNVNIDKCKKSIYDKDYNKAVGYAEKAVEADSKNSSSFYWLGMAYGMKARTASVFKKLSYAKKCKNAWITALELNSDNADAIVALMNYNLQAPGIAGGNKKEAKKLAVRLVKLDPVKGHTALAYIYDAEKDFESAEMEYKKIIEIQPKEVRPYLNLGYFYQKHKMWDKAREAFYGVLKKDPKNMEAQYQIGRTSVFSKSNLRDGINHLKLYLTVEPGNGNPDWAAAHWRLGMLYKYLAKKDSARYEFQTALKLNPKFKEALQALNSL